MPAAKAKRSQAQVWLRRLPWLAIVALTLWLVWRLAGETDWNAVRAALRARGGAELALIVAAALASHALYGMLDVIGAHSLGLRLSRWRCWLTATASYACNLNLGSLVGAAALRYRLYGRQGVATADVSRLIAMSMASNWLGYLLLLASLPLWGSSQLLSRWIGTGALVAISIAAVCVVGLYLYACITQQRWELRGHAFEFPRWQAGLAQISVGAANWALMGLVLRMCLGDKVDYVHTLAALLAAAIAGAVTHVPGGWGVLDFVIVKSLAGGATAAAQLMAGVLVYRAAYYLLPLILAGVSILRLSLEPKAPAVSGRLADG